MSLLKKKCVPCEGGVPALSKKEVSNLMKEISLWNTDNKKIWKRFEFKDFLKAMDFVNKMAKIAEKEGHHPDFTVHYNKVDVEIWTHAASGLTENDFILAAKIDNI